jgi:hypothetical protein
VGSRKIELMLLGGIKRESYQSERRLKGLMGRGLIGCCIERHIIKPIQSREDSMLDIVWRRWVLIPMSKSLLSHMCMRDGVIGERKESWMTEMTD